jgi:putative intracellular protease/amidase
VSHKDRSAVNPSRPKRAAIVISNSAVSTTTGWPVGFWWAELTHPYFAFNEAGWEVDIYEDELGKLGANYIHAGLWKGFAVRDGNLVTGQQNFSGREVAQVILEAVGR